MKKYCFPVILVIMLFAETLLSAGCGSKDVDSDESVSEESEVSTATSDSEKESEAGDKNDTSADTKESMFRGSGGLGNADDYEVFDGKVGYSDMVTYFTIPGTDKGIIYADLDDDGNDDEIQFDVYSDDYMVEDLMLTINGETFDLNEGIYFMSDCEMKCFWIRDDDEDNSQYLYIQQQAESDYNYVSMYWYSGDDLVYLDQLDGAVSFTAYDQEHDEYVEIILDDPNDFYVMRMEQVMGTDYYAERCYIDADGCPVCFEDQKYYVMEDEYHITVLTDIPCMYLESEESDGDGSTILEKGDKVKPYRTDGETYIDLEVDGLGGLFRIYYETGSNGAIIVDKTGDMSDQFIEDCFDGLIFAG